MTNNLPIIISVAPNGARKTKQDHSNLPMTAKELAYEAKACQEAGAALIHLHVRDNEGKHTLDTATYLEAMEAVKKAVGEKLIIQVTSEAVGMYTPEQQMQMVREVKPEAVSLAIKELMPDESYEKQGAEFLAWVERERILPQYIIYSEAELRRFVSLTKRGIIPGDRHSVLFVLGRYSKDQTSSAYDLLPYLSTAQELALFDKGADFIWSVCAFGPQEASCMLTSAAFGGNPRIGFENNMYLYDGSTSPNTAALVEQFCRFAKPIQRSIADADMARKLFRGEYQNAEKKCA